MNTGRVLQGRDPLVVPKVGEVQSEIIEVGQYTVRNDRACKEM